MKYADDKNSEVRTWAINVLCAIAGEIGYGKLQPYLKNLRPPIIKSIEDKLDEAGNGKEYDNIDEKPIRVKGGQTRDANRGKAQPIDLEVGNEFIDIPKKKAS